MPLSNIYLAPTWQISAQILCINNNLNSFGPYFGHDSWSSFRLEALPQGQQKKEIQILSIWIYSKKKTHSLHVVFYKNQQIYLINNNLLTNKPIRSIHWNFGGGLHKYRRSSNLDSFSLFILISSIIFPDSHIMEKKHCIWH